MDLRNYVYKITFLRSLAALISWQLRLGIEGKGLLEEFYGLLTYLISQSSTKAEAIKMQSRIIPLISQKL